MATPQTPKDPSGKDIPAYTIPEVKIHVMARKWLYFTISGAIMIPGIIAMIICMSKFGAPVKLGVDFTGGSLLQMRFEQKVEIDQFRHALHEVRIPPPTVEPAPGAAPVKPAATEKVEGEIQTVLETAQRSSTGSAETASTLILRTKELKPNQVVALKEALADPKLKLGAFTTERAETVGPRIGAELMRNALYALAAGIVMILAYIAFRYQFDFAVCAIAAMVHDIVVMTGAFAILSLTLGAEGDGLFITALLTVMGFSVHDTIVIFDRFRENLRYAQKGDTFADIADRSINQTFLRSIYTSVTVLLSLLPLVIFGGSSIFFFTLAMVIGIISGTYSSIFNAAPLLVIWRDGLGTKRSPAGASTPA